MGNAAVSIQWARAALDALARAGVRTICLCPGFRNSPLIVAAHERKDMQIFTHVDERGAAYFALGLIRATGMPAVVVCTSGTAAGNFLPAAMEADHSRLPLIILTADRPQEMIGIGANQATRQAEIFAVHTRGREHLLAYSAEPVLLAHLDRAVSALVGRAVGAYPGPVHLNMAFREPFLPDESELGAIPEVKYGRTEIMAPDSSCVLPEKFIQELKRAKRPLFLIGAENLSENTRSALAALSRQTSVPVWWEAAGGEITGSADGSGALWELYPREEGRIPAPDLIVQLGGAPTSRAWADWRRRWQGAGFWVFDHAEHARDPSLLNSKIFSCAPTAAILALAAKAGEIKGERDPEWSAALRAEEGRWRETMGEALRSASDSAEPLWIRSALTTLPERAEIFLGNSMPIRDFNRFAPAAGKLATTWTNRGLSGIDGNIALALGILSARRRPLLAALGDLTAFHDWNSMALAKKLAAPFVLLVINNGGGEIFRQVGTGGYSRREEWFTTPTPVAWSSAAAAFGAQYFFADSATSLRVEMPKAWSAGGFSVVEFRTESSASAALRAFPGGAK